MGTIHLTKQQLQALSDSLGWSFDLNMRRCFLNALMVAWTLCVSEAQAAKPRVISSDETGVTVEVNGLDYALIPVEVEGTTFQRL